MSVLGLDANGNPVELVSVTTPLGEAPGSTQVDVATGLPFKGAADSTLAALNIIAAAVQTAVDAINGKTPASPATEGTVSGLLTNDQLRAAAVPVDVAGELVEAIQALRMSVQSLNRSVGLVTVDLAGRQRTVADITSLPTLANVTNIATLAALTTLANQANIGGIAANHQVPAIMQMSADNLRRNIIVS